jgi:hypothetical protein
MLGARQHASSFPIYMAQQNDKAQLYGPGSVSDFIGAGEKSRTPDLRITNALLYQLSYAGQPLWSKALFAAKHAF